MGQRKESIDNTGNDHLGQAIYDLEDEDNMALRELPNDDITDYFLRTSVLQSDSSVSINVEVGKIEMEITEHIIKKVAETLVQDFPQSNRYWVEKESILSDQKTKNHLQVKLSIEEIMTKIRVKKETSSAKVLGLNLKLS